MTFAVPIPILITERKKTMTQFAWAILKQKVNEKMPIEEWLIRSIVERNQIGRAVSKRFNLYTDDDVKRIIEIAKRKAEK